MDYQVGAKKNCFKGFLTSYWLTYTTLVNNRLFVHWCTALKGM